MLDGVPKEERRARIGEIAAGMNHWAIPQEEGMHLRETVHSGPSSVATLERVVEDRLLDELLVRHAFSLRGVALLAWRYVLHGGYVLQCLEGLPHLPRYLRVS